MEYVLGISLCLLIYAFGGYGLLLFVIPPTYSLKSFEALELPEISICLSVFNEEQNIVAKIKNTLELNYPKDKFKLWIINDGSNDNTAALIESYRANYPNNIVVIHQERSGKLGAIRNLIQHIKTEFVVFTDADTLLTPDSLIAIVNPLADEKVGIVACTRRNIVDETGNITETEGIYWKYEAWLKQQEAKFGCLIAVTGDLFAMRTQLFPEIPPNSLVEDFYISMSVVEKGYYCVDAPNAIVNEPPSIHINSEYRRKLRIAVGGFQSLWQFKHLLNPLKYPKIALFFFSHRVLRMINPLLLILAFVSNAYLSTIDVSFQVLFYFQLIFYINATLGYVFQEKSPKLIQSIYYFCMMHIALLHGLVKFIAGKQTILWSKQNPN